MVPALAPGFYLSPLPWIPHNPCWLLLGPQAMGPYPSRPAALQAGAQALKIADWWLVEVSPAGFKFQAV
jgi:hypothetical protein